MKTSCLINQAESIRKASPVTIQAKEMGMKGITISEETVGEEGSAVGQELEDILGVEGMRRVTLILTIQKDIRKIQWPKKEDKSITEISSDDSA